MARTVVATPKPDISAPTDMSLLGAFIRHRRTHLGMTLEDAAALCGVSKQAYNNVELGEKNLRVSTLFSVLSALGIILRIEDIEACQTSTDHEEAHDDWL